MEVTLFVLADAANKTAEGKLNILGQFNQVKTQTLPAVVPMMQLVVRFEASTNEGPTHRFRLRILDEDGNLVPGSRVLEADMSLGEQFAPGHPYRAQMILGVANATFPAEGAYEFEIAVDDSIVTTTPLYVVREVPQDPAG